jgi:SAM-dependent methyltransferase
MIDGEDHANILPAMNAEADVVGCFAVLHHIPTVAARRNAVKELARILKPGGTAVVTVWNIRRFPFRSFLNWCAAWLRFSRIEGGEGGDVWIPWRAEGKWIQRYVHACTLREFRLLFDSQEWIIERCEAWGRTGPTTVWSGGNLVILARRRL